MTLSVRKELVCADDVGRARSVVPDQSNRGMFGAQHNADMDDDDDDLLAQLDAALNAPTPPSTPKIPAKSAPSQNPLPVTASTEQAHTQPISSRSSFSQGTTGTQASHPSGGKQNDAIVEKVAPLAPSVSDSSAQQPAKRNLMTMFRRGQPAQEGAAQAQKVHSASVIHESLNDWF